MKAISLSTLAAAVTLLATSAYAQNTTDEARAMAQATAAQQRMDLDHPPALEPTAAGDYRAEAEQRERLRQWQASQRAVQTYRAGVRSQPLAVTSTDTARAEAQRVLAEQALAERAALQRSTASAR